MPPLQLLSLLLLLSLPWFPATNSLPHSQSPLAHLASEGVQAAVRPARHSLHHSRTNAHTHTHTRQPTTTTTTPLLPHTSGSNSNRNSGSSSRGVCRVRTDFKYVRGGASEACPFRNISFGACALLFSSKYRVHCDGFFYSHQTCHFLNSTTPSFELVDLDRTHTPSHYKDGILVLEGGACENFSHSNTTAPLHTTFDWVRSQRDGVTTAETLRSTGKSFHRKKSMAQNSKGGMLKTPSQLYKSCLIVSETATHNHTREEKMFSEREYEQLPLLNIVLTTTRAVVDRDQNSFRRVLNHWNCYARIHSYNCTTNILESADDHTDVSQFLNASKYTLFLNANSVSLNMSRSLEMFLLKDKSVILQMKGIDAISSDIYLIRNDYRARCFLRYVQFFHPKLFYTSSLTESRLENLAHSANAKLVVDLHGSGAKTAIGAAVLGLLPDRAVVSCLEAWPASPLNSLFNLSEVYQESFSASNHHVKLPRSTEHPDLSIVGNAQRSKFSLSFSAAASSVLSVEQKCLKKFSHFIYTLGTAALRTDLGVYVLWSGEGLSRYQVERSQPTSTALPESCYPSSDFIRHGTGSSIADKYMPSKSNQCLKSFMKDVWRGKGESEECEWTPPNEEIEVLLQSVDCLFSSPACNDTDRIKLWSQNHPNIYPTTSGELPPHSRRVSIGPGGGRISSMWRVKWSSTAGSNNACSQYLASRPHCSNSSKLFTLKSLRTKLNYSIY